jgi:DNA-binding response OmpR family regulator
MQTSDDRDGEMVLANLRFSRSRCSLWIADEEIPLTRRDVLLLELLLGSVGKIVTRDAMIERAWGTEFDGSERAVDVYLSRLRWRVFDLAACPLKIKSVRGMGYKVTAVVALSTQPKTAEQPWQDQAHPTRVLVVDDSVVTRTAAAHLLTKLGCQVDLAETGLGAVAMAGEQDYNVIFMDVEMPELDGCEATRQIRAGFGAHRPAIAAMTAHSRPEDRERCWQVGMDVDDLWHLVDHDQGLLDEMKQAFAADWVLLQADPTRRCRTADGDGVRPLAPADGHPAQSGGAPGPDGGPPNGERRPLRAPGPGMATVRRPVRRDRDVAAGPEGLPGPRGGRRLTRGRGKAKGNLSRWTGLA